ncbi:MAG: TolC family protein [Marinifilaceae bacterium]|nr:TolC family protein [Marinifilaceae bacterium]
MRLIRFTIVALILGCVSSIVNAQTRQSYGLKECLDVGLQNNYSILIVKNKEQQSSNNVTLGNAGYLPTLALSAGYSTGVDNSTTTKDRATGIESTVHGEFDHTVNLGLNLNWTIFDGFSINTNYKRLKELEMQGQTATRIALEDFIAQLTSSYYNLIQQTIRLKNFRYAMNLSKERLRIVEARYMIGNFSRLDYQQAKVDFNADSAQYMKQQEKLQSARINLNELMANMNVEQLIGVVDTSILVYNDLDFDALWNSTLQTNAELIYADQNKRLSELEYKQVKSRNYPYLKLNGGYGYTLNRYGAGSVERRGNLGFNAGVTLGINIFDGNRSRERKNARLEIERTELQRQELKLALRADFCDLWNAYTNNLELLNLEKQNVVTALENMEIAMERYMLGDLSGIEMREAQKSLLDAEERLLAAEYDTKVCEISLLQISGGVTRYLE